MNTIEPTHFKSLVKSIGPGLLFASTAIGTSNLVLSTRAGAEHGVIFLVIIFFALLLKYPFYEFGPRYATHGSPFTLAETASSTGLTNS